MEEESELVEEVDISVLSPHIRNHVEMILIQPNIGLCHKEVEIMNPRPSLPSHNQKDLLEGELADCDRFEMIIPYAGTPVECMVVFQSMLPECPPDFVFSDSRFFVPINQIDSLCNWDVRKSDGLLQTMKEIMQFYKKRQIQELDKYEHLSFEYLCLFQLQNFHEDDIEILVPSDPDSPVVFLIRLHVDFRSLLPDFYEEGSETEEYPLLFVTFPSRDSNRSNQRLYLSKDIETLLGISETFQLPGDITDHYLTRYIVALEEELKRKSELAAARYEKRKLYFIKFLGHFDHSVIEYDILYFTNMVLLLKEDDFFFIVEINLPDDFPLGTPALVFRSIYHTFMGEPIAIAIDSYPYSPAWSVHKILKETVKFIEEYVPLFRQDSTPYFCEYQIVNNSF